MAESAERAKKRRQQEEEERLKAQERARKKAAELEAKMATNKGVEASDSIHDPSKRPMPSASTSVPISQTVKSIPTEVGSLLLIFIYFPGKCLLLLPVSY